MTFEPKKSIISKLKKSEGRMRFKAEILEDYRWKHRWTKTKMAKFLGISQPLYQYIIKNGQNDYRKIAGYARKMKVKFEDFIEW